MGYQIDQVAYAGCYGDDTNIDNTLQVLYDKYHRVGVASTREQRVGMQKIFLQKCKTQTIQIQLYHKLKQASNSIVLKKYAMQLNLTLVTI